MKRLIPLELLQEHFADHYAKAKAYVEAVNQSYNTELFVNPAALYVAIQSAYDDVERYKLYHQQNPEVQKSNSVKRVAYLTKWILKTRPIQYNSTEKNLTDVVPYISNAGFALALARSHISAELGRDFAISEQKQYELVYDFSYRELAGDCLLAIYQVIYDLVREISPIEQLTVRNFKNEAK